MQQTIVEPKQLNKSAVLSKAVLNTAEYLSIPNARLARILGVSPSTISRLGAGNYLLSDERKEWDFAVLFVRLFRSLDSIVGGSPDAAKAWMNNENKGLAGQKPVNLIESTEGLVHVVNYLDTIRGVI